MKENSREDRINNAYCFLNSMHSDFRTGLYYKEDLENLEHILSDYKRVLEINEVLLKENEEIKIKNNAIKRESEAYAEHMIRLDNELNLEKEKSKYEWIRQNCLPQELVNKLYIPLQKVKDKIEELKRKINNGGKTYGRYGGCVINSENIMKLQNQIEALKELLEGRK